MPLVTHMNHQLFFSEMGVLNPPKSLHSFDLNECCTVLPTLTVFHCFSIWNCYLYCLPSDPERKKKNNSEIRKNKPEKVKKLSKGYQSFFIPVSTDTQEVTVPTHLPASPLCITSTSELWADQSFPVLQFLCYGMELPLVVGENDQLLPLCLWNTYSPGANGLS